MGSTHFWIRTTLHKPTYIDLEKIIINADLKGFCFINFLNNPKNHTTNPFLTSKQTIENINLKTKEEYSDLIFSKYQDTNIYLNIYFSKKENSCCISWNTEHSSWNRKFSVLYSSIDEDDIPEMRDNARYARLQLELVKNFPLDCFQINEEDFHASFEEIPSDSIKVKFMTELKLNILVQELTYNILYNKCIMLDSIENKKEYSIDDFKKIFYHSIKYGVHFNFVAKQEDQLLNVIINNKNEITITPINYIKKFSFEDKEFVDIPFYVRLILGFCEDLVILQLETNFEQA